MITVAGGDLRKGNSLSRLVGLKTGPDGNQGGESSKTKSKSTVRPSYTTPRYMCKGVDACSTDTSAVFIAAPLTIAGKQKQPKSPKLTTENENVIHIYYVL